MRVKQFFLLQLLVVIFVLFWALTALPNAHAQTVVLTGTPSPTIVMPSPTSFTSSSADQNQTGSNTLFSQMLPVVITAFFALVAGFLGVKRLSDLDTEIRLARQERDQLRQEIYREMQNRLESSLSVLQERISVFQDKIDSKIEQVVDAQKREIERSTHLLQEETSISIEQIRKLLSDLENQRAQFLDETAWLRKTVIRRPRNVKDAHDLATLATTAGRRIEAIQILQLILDPEANLQGTANDYFNSAVQAASLGDFVLARQIDAKGLEYFSEDIDLLLDYADNCAKTGEIQEANRIWFTLSENPKAKLSWRYWIFYSDFLEKQGDLDKSAQLLEKAIKELPNPTMAYREQAEMLETRGQYEEAITLYEKALQYDPSEDIARLKLAQLFYKLGKLDQAYEHVNWAIRYVLPRNARYFTAHYLKAQILLAMGKREEAKRALRVAALNDEDAQVLLMTIQVEDGEVNPLEGDNRPTNAST